MVVMETTGYMAQMETILLIGMKVYVTAMTLWLEVQEMIITLLIL